MAMPESVAASRPLRFSKSLKQRTTQSSTGTGPAVMSTSARRWSMTFPARSVSATMPWAAPRSAASTERESGAKAKVEGGRPPEETAGPTAPMSPMSSSASTRAAIVERERPVRPASSERVRGRPSRRYWNSSPAPVPGMGGLGGKIGRAHV